MAGKCFYSTNLGIANSLGDTDLDFGKLDFLYFLISQIYNFPGRASSILCNVSAAISTSKNPRSNLIAATSLGGRLTCLAVQLHLQQDKLHK